MAPGRSNRLCTGACCSRVSETAKLLAIILLVISTLSDDKALGQQQVAPTPTAAATGRDVKAETDGASSIAAGNVSSGANSNSSNTTVAMQFPEHLVTAAVPPVERGKWNQISKNLWDILVTLDFDFVDNATGMIVPATFPRAVVQTPVLCGRVARTWIRMPFHDCGTHSVNSTADAATKGGCNGSLRKELPATEPFVDVKTGTVIHNDTFDVLGALHKSQADYAFDPARRENAGFAVSTAIYYQQQFAAHDLGLNASWADIEVLAGMLSVVVCGGPHILFVPGRQDIATADPPGMLPMATASVQQLKQTYHRNGLGLLYGLTLQQGGHSTSCFAAGCLDSTPDRLDNQIVKELLARGSGSTGSNSMDCKFSADGQPSGSSARCIAPFDAALLQDQQTKSILRLLASNISNPDELKASIAAHVSSSHNVSSSSAVSSPGISATNDDNIIHVVFLAEGSTAAANSADGPQQLELLWRVNLCTPDRCDQHQWAFSHLFATAYYKMTSLGLQDGWIGHSWNLTGAEAIDVDGNNEMLPVPTTVDVNSTGLQSPEGLLGNQKRMQPSFAAQMIVSWLHLLGATVLGLLWMNVMAQ